MGIKRAVNFVFLSLLMLCVGFFGYKFYVSRATTELVEIACNPVSISHYIITQFPADEVGGPETIISYICEDSTYYTLTRYGHWELEDIESRTKKVRRPKDTRPEISADEEPTRLIKLPPIFDMGDVDTSIYNLKE